MNKHPPEGDVDHDRPPALEFIGIDKKFGSVHANRTISLQIAQGSIHGIIGENGAGKSTLMSILFGLYEADHGEIKVRGTKIHIRNSADALNQGIGMVHQHFMLVHSFSVLENIVLGNKNSKSLKTSLAHTRRQLERLARLYDMAIDPDALVSELPLGLQQRVEILKALLHDANILILDEPTAALTADETAHLFGILRKLKEQGKTIILITHKLREVMDLTDQVSVMRRGEIIITKPTPETTMAELAHLMVGRSVLLTVKKTPARPGPIMLRLKDLTVKDDRNIERLKQISLTVHCGEIVGIAGVSGNGQSELLETIAGLRKAVQGNIFLEGREIGQELNPHRARQLGIAHIPEDRQHRGLVMDFEAAESAMLGWHLHPQFGSALYFNRQKIIENCAKHMHDFDIRPADPLLRTKNFSGGNQQKIILAREINNASKLLLVGQPTRGVDIGAIEFIHQQLIALRDAGKAILLVSAELDEIRSLADRIYVMFAGKIAGERPAHADEQNEHALGTLMTGSSPDG